MAAVAVAAVALAGCGGGGRTERDGAAAESRQAYERQMRAAVVAARDAGGGAPALRAAAVRLRALTPPAEVAAAHRALADGFAAVAAARTQGREVSDEVADRILAARRAFASRGYDIGVYGPLR